MPGSLFPFHILAAARTPMGCFGGSLRAPGAVSLGDFAIRGALKAVGMDGSRVTETVMGCAFPIGMGPNPARQAARAAGLPAPAWTLDQHRLSGLAAIAQACRGLQPGEIAIAGGFESLSQVPYLLPTARWGRRMGETELLDPLVTAGMNLTATPLSPHLSAPLAIELPTRQGPRVLECDDALPDSAQTDFWADGAAALVLAGADDKNEPMARISPVAHGDSAVEAFHRIQAKASLPHLDFSLLADTDETISELPAERITGLPPGPAGALLLMALYSALKSGGHSRGVALQSNPDGQSLAILMELP